MRRTLGIASLLLVASRVLAHPGLHDEIDTLSETIARDPRNATLYLERAYGERLDGQLVRALADLDRAAALAPKDTRVAAERGLVLAAQGRDREADVELTRFLESAAATAPVLAGRARVRLRLGRTREALRDFDAAIALRPDPDLYFERGGLLERLGRLAEAAAGYRDGIMRLSGAASIRAALLRVEKIPGPWVEAPALADDPSLPRAQEPRPARADGVVTVIRSPYLQLGTPTSMTIVWQTDLATDSRVRFGTTAGVLDRSAEVAESVTNHVVTITGLVEATRYYYDVGSTTESQAGGTPEHYFATSPDPGSTTPFRVWVVGDSGLGNVAQAQVRDAMLALTGATRPDLFLHMGDIAYFSGTEGEFTAYHFAPYRDILRHTVLWPTLGNHEGASTVSGAPGPSIGPYYEAFVLPTGAEAGGLPSGTEAYYSFDHANVHFVSLNSYQVDRSATGAMATWLEADLAANTLPWVIAYWHHPPYTHGTHNSDLEIEHIEMRENILPILEDAGVDLVLGGHSHSYERSLLIDGTYTTPTPDLETLVDGGHVVNGGDGNPAGRGAYRKDPGMNPHDGTVYVVAGHGGAPTGGILDHPVMYYSEAVNGSVLLDVSDDTLTLRNVRAGGGVSDTFTLVKKLVSPALQSLAPSRGAAITLPRSVEVSFSVPVTGVDAADLTVGGIPAASVVRTSPDRYVFQIAAQPPAGVTAVVLAPGGIADGSNPSLHFAGDSWTYTVEAITCGSDTECVVLNKGCTAAGVCVAGLCQTTTPVPADVTGLRFLADRVTLAWDAISDPAASYDVARGGPSDLPVGSGAPACLEPGLSSPTASDASVPGAGGFLWYLVRGGTSCGPGIWGFAADASGPHERKLAACP